MNFWEEDICRCASESCEKYNECFRGKGHIWKLGIYTVSLLEEVCNEKNDFKLFVKGDKDEN